MIESKLNMSYQKITRGGFGAAKEFKKKGDSIEGYLVSVVERNRKHAKKGEKKSFFVFSLMGKSGEPIEFFGSTDINRALLNKDGELFKEDVGCKLRVKLTGTKDVGQPQPMRTFDVEIDRKDKRKISTKALPF